MFVRNTAFCVCLEYAADIVFSSDTSSFNEDRAKLTVFERAFVVPYGFAAMTTSETLWGISTKDLIGMHSLLFAQHHMF